MRQSVLYQETKCDHGYMDHHYTCEEIDHPEKRNFQHTEENCGCDGGVRDEFVVDRRAAVKVFKEAGYNNKGLQILLGQAIDASLGIVEPF